VGHSVYDYHIKRDAKIKRLSAVSNYSRVRRALIDDERIYISAVMRDVLTVVTSISLKSSILLIKHLKATLPSARKHCIGFGTPDSSRISNVTCLRKNSGKSTLFSHKW